jgi:hypothetical protein
MRKYGVGGQVYRQDTPLEYVMNFVMKKNLLRNLIYMCIPRRGILSVEKLHPSTILHTPEGYPIFFLLRLFRVGSRLKD